jgi:lipopolysaccharide export system protein LptC
VKLQEETMRLNYLILFLLVLAFVLGLYMSGDPEQAQRLDQMRRDAAFTGDTRDMVLLLAAVGIGGFIAYLTLTRR